jgi:hypothetical protein
MPSKGKATLGDALSPEMRARMLRLRDDLQRRAQETVKAQLGQPKAPWQIKVVPPKGMLGTRSKQISTKTLDSAAIRKEDLLRPLGGNRPVLLNTHLRSKARVSKTEPREEPFSYWELPPEAAVREPAPKAISAENRKSFESLLAAGSVPSQSESGEEIFATIGLDFGTSSTKVMVRFPYEPGAPTIAIPAPAHCRSMGDPYLWQTVLWLSESGEFTAWPPENAHLLHTLKQGVMGRNADALIVPNPQSRVSLARTDAATAFLTFVFRYSRGWLFTHRSRLFRKRRPVWFLNVGMPVANFDDASLVSVYRRIAAASMLLGNFDGPLNIETTRVFLTDRHVVDAAQSSANSEKLGVAVLPETAAEAAGFAKSTNRAPGVYLMVDVGAMTLDVCAFRLSEGDAATDLYALCAAQVRPLGVEAYHWFLGQGKKELDFVEQCDCCLREVVWGTKTKKDPHAECWQTGNDLPVFLVGGGAKNALHRRIVDSLNPWLRRYTQNEGARVIELPIPKNIDLPIAASDFGRLGVAWGLSHPPSEIGEIFSPSTVKDKPPPTAIDWTERFVGKEQV